jgi:hypothetical protein
MAETPVDGAPAGDAARRRALAKAALDSRRLPKTRPIRMWGGAGNGAACTVCMTPISRQALGYEVEFMDGEQGSAVHYLHMPCYTAWKAECASVNDETGPENGQANGHDHGGGLGAEDAR